MNETRMNKKFEVVHTLRLAVMVLNSDSAQSLKLNDVIIGEEGGRELSAVLEGNNCVNRLDLKGCGLENEGLKYLVESILKRQKESIMYELVLANNSFNDFSLPSIEQLLSKPQIHLVHLDLSSNSLGPYFSKNLSAGVAASLTLEVLILDNNPSLGGKAATEVLNGVIENNSLRNFSVSSCNLTRDAFLLVSNLIMLNKTNLKQLSMNKNKLDQVVAYKIGNALTKNTNLKILGLEETGLNHYGGFAIFDCFSSNTKIERLSVNNNQGIDAEMFMDLSESISKSSTLVFLDLSNSNVGNGSEFLFQGLSKANILEELKLSNNGIEAEGVISLFPWLKRLRCSLRVLDLSKNKLGDYFARELSASLKTNSSLQELDLTMNLIREEGITSLVHYLEGNVESLRTINLEKNNITGKTHLMLGSLLEVNLWIETLSIGGKMQDLIVSKLQKSAIARKDHAIAAVTQVYHNLKEDTESSLNICVKRVNIFGNQKQAKIFINVCEYDSEQLECFWKFWVHGENESIKESAEKLFRETVGQEQDLRMNSRKKVSLQLGKVREKVQQMEIEEEIKKLKKKKMFKVPSLEEAGISFKKKIDTLTRKKRSKDKTTESPHVKKNIFSLFKPGSGLRKGSKDEAVEVVSEADSQESFLSVLVDEETEVKPAQRSPIPMPEPVKSPVLEKRTSAVYRTLSVIQGMDPEIDKGITPTFEKDILEKKVQTAASLLFDLGFNKKQREQLEIYDDMFFVLNEPIVEGDITLLLFSVDNYQEEILEQLEMLKRNFKGERNAKPECIFVALGVFTTEAKLQDVETFINEQGVQHLSIVRNEPLGLSFFLLTKQRHMLPTLLTATCQGVSIAVTYSQIAALEIISKELSENIFIASDELFLFRSLSEELIQKAVRIMERFGVICILHQGSGEYIFNKNAVRYQKGNIKEKTLKELLG
eukprot:maker-scaffold_5-snap-gene-5.53-mRNA-1 protein AED:0.33 eAED:0.34 QI:13/1/0.5/1/1/1/2/0/937